MDDSAGIVRQNPQAVKSRQISRSRVASWGKMIGDGRESRISDRRNVNKMRLNGRENFISASLVPGH